jgi:hypothetical protein
LKFFNFFNFFCQKDPDVNNLIINWSLISNRQVERRFQALPPLHRAVRSSPGGKFF